MDKYSSTVFAVIEPEHCMLRLEHTEHFILPLNSDLCALLLLGDIKPRFAACFERMQTGTRCLDELRAGSARFPSVPRQQETSGKQSRPNLRPELFLRKEYLKYHAGPFCAVELLSFTVMGMFIPTKK